MFGKAYYHRLLARRPAPAALWWPGAGAGIEQRPGHLGVRCANEHQTIEHDSIAMHPDIEQVRPGFHDVQHRNGRIGHLELRVPLERGTGPTPSADREAPDTIREPCFLVVEAEVDAAARRVARRATS